MAAVWPGMAGQRVSSLKDLVLPEGRERGWREGGTIALPSSLQSKASSSGEQMAPLALSLVHKKQLQH